MGDQPGAGDKWQEIALSPARFVVRPINSVGDGAGTLVPRGDGDTSSISTLQSAPATPNRSGAVVIDMPLDEQDGEIPEVVVHQPGNRDPFEVAMATIEEERSRANPVPQYMYHFLKSIHAAGLSPFDPRMGRRIVRKGWKGLSLRIGRKAISWSFAVSAFLSPILYTKISWLVFASNGGINNFITVGFWTIPILIAVYIFHLLLRQQRKISKMLKSQKDLNAFVIQGREYSAEENKKESHITAIMLALRICSVIACALLIIFEPGVLDWTWKSVVLGNSQFLSAGLFIWTPDNFQNETILEQLHESYGDQATARNVMMGCATSFMDFAGELIMDMIRDMIIFGAMTVDENFAQLTNKLLQIDYNKIPVEVYERDYFQLDGENGYWAHYEKLISTIDDTNDVFDGILKFMHVHNLTLCGSFLMHCLDGNASGMTFAFLIYAIVKTSYAYKVAKEAKEKNKILEDWISNWSFHSKDKEFLAKVVGILNKMKNHPIGFGRGGFLIGESFIFKFAGLVGSLFSLKADVAKDEM